MTKVCYNSFSPDQSFSRCRNTESHILIVLPGGLFTITEPSRLSRAPLPHAPPTHVCHATHNPRYLQERLQC